MGYFPDVTRGEPFQPNSLLENNVRRLVNSMNGFTAGAIPATGGMIRIQVYNSSGAVIKAGTAVNFKEGGVLCDGAVPAEPLKDAAKPWGVVVNTLAAKALGSCILCGPATVSVSGSGDCAEPSTSDPATFTRGSTGAPVIFAEKGKGIVLLGASAQDNYDGPFAITYDAETKQLKVAAGYLSRNGEWVEVPAKEIAPASGMICVNSVLGNGEWSAPEIKFTSPGRESYPIGKCTVKGESVTISCFRTPVAIIIVSAECPLSAEADEE